MAAGCGSGAFPILRCAHQQSSPGHVLASSGPILAASAVSAQSNRQTPLEAYDEAHPPLATPAPHLSSLSHRPIARHDFKGSQPKVRAGCGQSARPDLCGGYGVIRIPTATWYLEFVPEDNWTMLHARQRPDHLVITALLHQVAFAATPESCKADLWPKMEQTLAGKAQDLQESSYGGAA